MDTTNDRLRKKRNFTKSIPFMLLMFFVAVVVIFGLYYMYADASVKQDIRTYFSSFFSKTPTPVQPSNTLPETKETFIFNLPDVESIPGYTTASQYLQSANDYVLSKPVFTGQTGIQGLLNKYTATTAAPQESVPAPVQTPSQEVMPSQEVVVQETVQSVPAQETVVQPEQPPKTCRVLPTPPVPNVVQNNTVSFADPNSGAPMIGAAYPNIFEYRSYDDIKYASPTKNGLVPANYYYLSDGQNDEMDVSFNMCSKSCCSKQYPTPFDSDDANDKFVNANRDLFVPNPMYCYDGSNNAGCLCLSKDQANFIYNRGGNGRDWF